MSNALEAKVIPEDVKQAAEACYAECEQMDSYGIVETIAKAILAERQAERDRCNAIVRAAWGQNVSLAVLEALTKAEAIVNHSTVPDGGTDKPATYPPLFHHQV